MLISNRIIIVRSKRSLVFISKVHGYLHERK